MLRPTITWVHALKEQGKTRKSNRGFKKAIIIKPDYAEAYYNMGNALKEQGKLEEAIEAYKKALWDQIQLC